VVERRNVKASREWGKGGNATSCVGTKRQNMANSPPTGVNQDKGGHGVLRSGVSGTEGIGKQTDSSGPFERTNRKSGE